MAERISDAEHAVMEVLWDEAPLTAQDVSERVDPERGWSTNTVKTLLGRLLAKEAIAHEEQGRRYLYRPLVAHLAERDELTAQDISEIEALLKELKA